MAAIAPDGPYKLQKTRFFLRRLLSPPPPEIVPRWPHGAIAGQMSQDGRLHRRPDDRRDGRPEGRPENHQDGHRAGSAG